MEGVKVVAGEAERERRCDKASALWGRRWEVLAGRRGGCAATVVSRAIGGFIGRRSPSLVLAAGRGPWSSELFGRREDGDGILKNWSSHSRGSL